MSTSQCFSARLIARLSVAHFTAKFSAFLVLTFPVARLLQSKKACRIKTKQTSGTYRTILTGDSTLFFASGMITSHSTNLGTGWTVFCARSWASKIKIKMTVSKLNGTTRKSHLFPSLLTRDHRPGSVHIPHRTFYEVSLVDIRSKSLYKYDHTLLRFHQSQFHKA